MTLWNLGHAPRPRNWRQSAIPALCASLAWILAFTFFYSGTEEGVPLVGAWENAWPCLWPCLVLSGGALVITRFGRRDRWRTLCVAVLQTFGLRPFSYDMWMTHLVLGLFFFGPLIYASVLALTGPRLDATCRRDRPSARTQSDDVPNTSSTRSNIV